MRALGHRLVSLATVAACATAPPALRPTPPTASPAAEATIAAELVDAIDRGDYGLALHALCAGYARLDLPCANTLHLSMLEPSDVMSRISLESHELHMQPMPTDGYAYWDNWSTILAHGAWQPRAWFVDERDARRAANTLLVTVLAHELGHHLADRHHCDAFARPASELRADQLSVPLIGALARADARLDQRHAQVRALADAMIEAVPARDRPALPARGDVVAWVEQQADLPTLPGAYAALHLARQRRVLLDPTLDLAPRCAATRHALAAQRRFASAGEVTTLRTLPQPSSAALALDRAGHVHALDVFDDDEVRVLRRLDAPSPPRTVTMPDATMITSFAAFGDTRFAATDDLSIWLLEGDDPTPRLVGAAPDGNPTLAFDARGELLVGHATKDAWVAGPVGGPPRWTVPRDPLDGSFTWGDGPAGHGRPSRFAIDGDRLVFVDDARAAIRVRGPTSLSTIAGGRAGRRDGPAAEAELFEPAALGIGADGGLQIVETSATSAILRAISP